LKSLSLGIPIGINSLGGGNLAALPGIGSELASRIVRFRNEKGRFQNVEEILLVEGIGEKKLFLIKPYINLD
jgi:competence protein ComEA